MSTTLVALPGMDGTGLLFEPLLRSLPPSISTSVVTYPAAELLGYRELEQVASAALPKDGPFFILGESFSGPVAIALAARAGSRLLGLILVCSFVKTPLPLLTPLRHLARFLPPPRVLLGLTAFVLMGKHQTPQLRRALDSALSSVAPSVLRHRAAAALAVDASDDLAKVKRPILYLQATEDRVVPSACASEVLRTARSATIQAVVGPHFLLQTQPAVAAAAIDSFVRGVEHAV